MSKNGFLGRRGAAARARANRRKRGASPSSTPRRFSIEHLEERCLLAVDFSTPILNFSGQGFSSVFPPDTNGDVGLANYVQATNGSDGTHITIYNKADGSIAVPQFRLETLAAGATGGTPYSGLGDPVVVYDHLADRWLLLELKDTFAEMEIFISDTGVPTGNGSDWTQYRISASFPDYPKITLWPDVYLIGTNEGDNPVYALDRNAMLTGNGGLITPIRRSTPAVPGWPFDHTMPVHWDGTTPPPVGSPGLFIRQVDDELVGGGNPASDSLELWAFNPNFANPASSTYSLLQSIPIAEFSLVSIGLGDIPQPNTNTRLDGLDDVFMWRPQYRNFGAYETLVGNFMVDDAATGPGVAGIRWFELRRTGGGPWTVYQEGTYSPDNTFRFDGSIAMDGAGNIALGYAVSSSTVFPGMRYVGRLATDPLGTMPQGEYTLVDGATSQTGFGGGRWGDYAAMVVDPADDSTFWFTSEYMSPSGRWATQIASMSFGIQQLGTPLIGVDFDIPGGVSPNNWTLYSGPQPTVLTDLINETGTTTNFDLSISTTGGPILSFPTPVNPDTIPNHTQPLDGVDGYIFDNDATWTFQWSDLSPFITYEVFVFGLTSLVDGGNHVAVSGLNPAVTFDQALTANNLFINKQPGSSDQNLGDFGIPITASADGTITIAVNQIGGTLGESLAGLAIRELAPSSIKGQKWNDLNSDGIKDPDEPGLGDWTIFLDENGNNQLDAAVQQTAASVNVPQPIADYQTITSTLFFTGLAAITDVDVTLDISHTYDADINAYLISPSGKRVKLFVDVGGSSDNFHQTTLDDEALISIDSGFAPFTGHFRPEEPLAAFDGENPNGIWTLEISDDAAGGVGILNSWSLTITGAERSAVTNQDGNYQFPSLRAGDYHVLEVLQPGWVQTHAPGLVTLGAGGGAIDVDFGNHALPGSISGQKWNDANGDGLKDAGEAGLEGWTINLLAPSDNPSTDTIDSTDVPVPINDLSTAVSKLTVGSLGAIQDVDVTIDLTHTYDSDLIGTLISPLGTRVELFFRVGGSGNDFQDTTFDDEATTPIGNGLPPFAGSFQPSESLSALDGEDPNGDWTLEIRDVAGLDFGSINSWSLTFTSNAYVVIDSTVTDNAGNYSFTDLVPGPYGVGEVLQPGWIQTFVPPAITVGPGQNVIDADIGNRALAGGIAGQKWDDKNADGIKQPGEPGLEGWTIYLDENNNGVFDPDAQTIATSNDSQPIADYNTAVSHLLYQGPSGNTDVNVTLNITHTYDADLVVYLTSPLGTRVKLFGDVGGSDNNFTSTTLDDEAFQPIANGLAPFTGSYQPEEALSAFDGQNPNGVWTLEVFDDAASDTGTINSWSIAVTGFEVATTTDVDGSYAFTMLPFGDYHVREVQQPGWTQTYSPPAVTIAPGDEFANVDLGNHAAVGSIQGYVYNDVAGNAAKDLTDPGLPGWRVYIDADGDVQYGLDSINDTVDADVPQAINSFFVVSSSLWFDTLTEITDVNLTLDITHTYDSDLTAYLIGPTGTRVKLFSHVGGSGNDFQNTEFDDSAIQSITIGSAPFDDVFIPEELLSAFNGQNAYGLWTLEITDSSVADNGSLNSWSLEVTGNEFSTVTNAQGAYAFMGLAPGDYAIGVVQKPGWIQTEIPVGPLTIAPAQNVLNHNFGDRPPVHLLGDYNRDGSVDSADYALWRMTLNSIVTNFAGADGDGDGTIDQDDYDVWRAHYGDILPTAGAGSEPLAAATDLASSTLQDSAGYNGGTTVVAGSLLPTVQFIDSAETTVPLKTLSNVQPTVSRPILRPVRFGAGSLVPPKVPLVKLQTVEPEQASTVLESVPLKDLPSLLQTLSQADVGASSGTTNVKLDFNLALQSIDKPTETKREKLLFSSNRTSALPSDLGLLAWLDSESAGNGAQVDLSKSTTDLNFSSSGESSEQLDAAFETLEASALAGAAI